jgi:hypothetical protein
MHRSILVTIPAISQLQNEQQRRRQNRCFGSNKSSYWQHESLHIKGEEAFAIENASHNNEAHDAAGEVDPDTLFAEVAIEQNTQQNIVLFAKS